MREEASLGRGRGSDRDPQSLICKGRDALEPRAEAGRSIPVPTAGTFCSLHSLQRGILAMAVPHLALPNHIPGKAAQPGLSLLGRT